MHKRGNAELWIFLVFIVIAFGGAIYALMPGKSTTGMTSIRATWGAAYVPVVAGPGDLGYMTLQCQSNCKGRPIETAMHDYPIERRGGDSYVQCLSWCRNRYRVAGEMEIKGKYSLDTIKKQQQYPPVEYPASLNTMYRDIPKVSQEDLPPGVFKQQII